MAGGLSADSVQSPYQLPSNSQVIGYLLQSMSWYRHGYAERQVANEPADLIFLNDNQAIEAQIVKLSFEFGKADAALARTASVPDSPSVASPDAVPSDCPLYRFEESQRSGEPASNPAHWNGNFTTVDEGSIVSGQTREGMRPECDQIETRRRSKSKRTFRLETAAIRTVARTPALSLIPRFVDTIFTFLSRRVFIPGVYWGPLD